MPANLYSFSALSKPLSRSVNHEMLSAHRNYAFGPNGIQRPAAELQTAASGSHTLHLRTANTCSGVFPSGKQWTMLKSTPSLHTNTNTVGGAPSQDSQGLLAEACQAGRFSTCTQPCKCPSQSRGLGSPRGTSGGTGLSSLANLLLEMCLLLLLCFATLSVFLPGDCALLPRGSAPEPGDSALWRPACCSPLPGAPRRWQPCPAP